ncbi:MAG TPA: GNAT family protein [Thermomicrobiaceae bacterium]|nr:GNAT family protein [Thermomicrobiaceae bacterium]
MESPDSQESAPIMNIVGERVMLGPLRREQIPLRLRWANDLTTNRAYDLPRPVTEETFRATYDPVVGETRHIRFTLYERATRRPIGHASLLRVELRDRTAEFDLLIGEADARGRGYGTEATQLVLDYAFTALGLHSIFLRVYAFNLAGIRAYEKAGFREVARRHECFWMGGRFWDMVFMDCLARESARSESPVLGRVFVPDAPRPSREGGAG